MQLGIQRLIAIAQTFKVTRLGPW